MIAKKITVFGKVQGVGYRSKVRQLAAIHSVTGFVKNEPDGNVTIFAQGKPKNLQKFMNTIKISEWPAHVTKIRASASKPDKHLSVFKIQWGNFKDEMMEKSEELIIHLGTLGEKIDNSANRTADKMDNLIIQMGTLGANVNNSSNKTSYKLDKVSSKLDKLDKIDNTLKSQSTKLDKLDKLDKIDNTIKSGFDKLHKLDKLDNIDHAIKSQSTKLDKLDKLDKIDNTIKSQSTKLDKLDKIDNTIKSEFGKLDKKYDKFSDAILITNRLLARIADKI